MKNEESRSIVVCDFDGGLHMPNTCVVCGSQTENIRYEKSATNKFHTRKVIVSFPICEDCFQADKDYVNQTPVLLIGSVAFLLSVFSLFTRPEKYPPLLFIIGGITWLLMIISYLLYTIIKAKKMNTSDVIRRHNEVIHSVKIKRYYPQQKNSTGTLVIDFGNNDFAKQFRKRNHGKILEKK